jgi:hypothetical protein
MVRGARRRAKWYGVPFDLRYDDFSIPALCPILGVAMARNVGGRKQGTLSPTLDRKVPALGYVPSNVWVISSHANMVKGSRTLKEFKEWLRANKQCLNESF